MEDLVSRSRPQQKSIKIPLWSLWIVYHKIMNRRDFQTESIIAVLMQKPEMSYLRNLNGTIHG